MQQMIFSDPIKLNAVRYVEKEALLYVGKRFTYSTGERFSSVFAFSSTGVSTGGRFFCVVPGAKF